MIAFDANTALTAVGTYDAWVATLNPDTGDVSWAARFGSTAGTHVTDVVYEPTYGRVVAAGYFEGLTQFDDKELTAKGGDDGYVADIIPK
jgi:hypothetical protein